MNDSSAGLAVGPVLTPLEFAVAFCFNHIGRGDGCSDNLAALIAIEAQRNPRVYSEHGTSPQKIEDLRKSAHIKSARATLALIRTTMNNGPCEGLADSFERDLTAAGVESSYFGQDIENLLHDYRALCHPYNK